MHLQLIGASSVEVIDEAKEAVGTAALLPSDNGPGYLSRAVGCSLRLAGIRHI